ncbi:MAG: glycosyltransferase [Cyanobacteria bacterium P01_D01_bin.73]
MSASPLKYAMVHEWLTPMATGGSELVVEQILQHIDADLFALIDFESVNPDSYLYGRKIGSTFLQRLPGAKRGVQKYLPLLPLAIEQLDVRDYDVVLSSSHAVAKGVLTHAQQMHLCYCHAPMRYAWDLTQDYLNASRVGRGLPGIITRHLLHQLRQWDALSANRVDYFIANSCTTARRIWRCYRRRSEVIYPPVNVQRFSRSPSQVPSQFPPKQFKNQDYYLTVTRLVSYKKVSLMVDAFTKLGRPFVVIGGGKALDKLRSQAGSSVILLGEQPDAVVEDYMRNAKAFVYAAFEDFGIAPVEAQAAGIPVIALNAGGTSETVRDIRRDPKGGTGIHFPGQTIQALADAVVAFEEWEAKFSAEAIARHAQNFSHDAFALRYLNFLKWAWNDWNRRDRQEFAPPDLSLPPRK